MFANQTFLYKNSICRMIFGYRSRKFLFMSGFHVNRLLGLSAFFQTQTGRGFLFSPSTPITPSHELKGRYLSIKIFIGSHILAVLVSPTCKIKNPPGFSSFHTLINDANKNLIIHSSKVGYDNTDWSVPSS